MTHGLNRNRRWTLGFALAIGLTGAWAMAAAQHGGGHGMRGGGMGMMHDGAHGADMQIFHALFDARDRITRQLVSWHRRSVTGIPGAAPGARN